MLWLVEVLRASPYPLSIEIHSLECASAVISNNFLEEFHSSKGRAGKSVAKRVCTL